MHILLFFFLIVSFVNSYGEESYTEKVLMGFGPEVPKGLMVSPFQQDSIYFLQPILEEPLTVIDQKLHVDDDDSLKIHEKGLELVFFPNCIPQKRPLYSRDKTIKDYKGMRRFLHQVLEIPENSIPLEEDLLSLLNKTQLKYGENKDTSSATQEQDISSSQETPYLSEIYKEYQEDFFLTHPDILAPKKSFLDEFFIDQLSFKSQVFYRLPEIAMAFIVFYLGYRTVGKFSQDLKAKNKKRTLKKNRIPMAS